MASKQNEVLKFEEQLNLNKSIDYISSIHVNKEDNHIFACNFNNKSIIEYSERGEFFWECHLLDGMDKFYPEDMCSIPPNLYVVASGLGKKLFFLKKRKTPPFLKTIKIIDTENKFYSLCPMKESIYACDLHFQVDSFTKEGEKIKTIKTGGSRGYNPLIRADPSSGNFWITRMFSSEIFCFNSNGEKHQSVKIEGTILDFSVNEFGHFYFCKEEGLFSFTSKKYLWEFEKTSEFDPRLFVLANRIYVCLKIDGQYLIKIFEKLESTDQKCNLCSKKEINSAAENWCDNCQELFCAHCSSFHEAFLPKHNVRDWDGIEKTDVLKVIKTDICSLHQKPKHSYCERCNMCLCDTCYLNHSNDSPRCSSRQLSVRERAPEQKPVSPTLTKIIDDLDIEESRLSVKEMVMKFSEELKIKTINSISSKVEESNVKGTEKLPPVENILIDQEWNLHEPDAWIPSIHISEEDTHIFICNVNNQSIDEYTEDGKIVYKCVLSDGTNRFVPIDVCSILPNIMVIACGWQNKLIYLKRRICPFLQIKTIIHTKENFLSLCQVDGTIFACDHWFKIVSFTKEGVKKRTIKTQESGSDPWPLIRADPSTGNLWGTRFNSSEILCINPNGEKLRSVKTEKTISDFSLNEFGFIFCNFGGIFSSSAEKYWYKFEKRSEDYPRISVLRDKIFVCLKNNGRNSIKIFRRF